MAEIIPVRNLTLRKVEDAVSLAASFTSETFMDFKEMNVGMIQLIFDGQGASDGKFSLDVSLICDPTTFCPLPDSEKEMLGFDAIAYHLCNFAWRYARIRYEAGPTALGTVTVWARAKRT
jgi:hypothetical protein